MNLAVTDFAAFIVTVHVWRLPLQAPLQYMNSDPSSAIANSVTMVPALYAWVQFSPQSIPAGVEST